MEGKIHEILKNPLKQKLSELCHEKNKQQILNLPQDEKEFSNSNSEEEEDEDKENEKKEEPNNEMETIVYLEKFKTLLKDIPIEGLSPEWEKNIKKSVEKLFKNKYDCIFTELMCEIRKNYFEQMQIFTIKRILIFENEEYPQNFEFIQKKEILSLKNESFHKNRSLLMKKYFLSHSLVRFIIKTAFFNLPKLFLNFNDYRDRGYLELIEFNKKINNDIKKASLKILSHYYNLIIKVLPKLLKKNQQNQLSRIINCATHLFSQQILNIKMNTINHLINSIKNPLTCPLLKLDLVFENNNLVLKPNILEICLTFHEIITNLSLINTDLVPFEYYFRIKTKKEFININLPEWFLNESHTNLDFVLENIFQILQEYHYHVNLQFQQICQPETRDGVLKLISENREFETYCSQVKIYLKYQSEVNGMISKFYYNTGILNQLPAREILKSKTQELKNILLDYLTEFHFKEAENICFEFENLKIRALNIPKDANSLFELSEYMTHGAKELVIDLEKRVILSIQQLSSLLEITLLTDHHINLNKQNINWLEAIKPIFIQSNTLSEAMKSESEDELQQQITILNTEIDILIPDFVILDDMDDAMGVQNYRQYLKSLLAKMHQIEMKISRINFEERLFKFPETMFPKDSELREIIEPFSILVDLICEWQRDHDVWLKGPFEYLNAEVIEKKTQFYHQKIIESNKMFKSKIKMDVTANKAFKFSGIVDDPDAMQQPAPLKLCWQILKTIENFLNFVPLAICFCNSALRKRHWNEMSTVSGCNLLPNAGTTLEKFIQLDLMKHIEIFQVISTGANKELALQNQIENMFKKWESINFEISETNEIFHFKESETIELLLDEHFSKIHNIRGSYFIKPAENRVLELETVLFRLKTFIQKWHCVQELTKKYQPLFSNSQAAENLPKELILFEKLQESLLALLENKELTFAKIGKNSEIIKNLDENFGSLKIIQAGIKEYLEQQRFAFPRFFFTSDDEILKILFQKKSPKQFGLQLAKCFPGVKNFHITNSFRIKFLIGDFNEKVRFDPVIVNSTGGWLNELEEKILKILKSKLLQLNENFHEENIFQNPSMIINCCCQIHWTKLVENSFDNGSIVTTVQKNGREVISKNLDQLKNCQTKLKRRNLSSLLSVQIYQNQIIEMLIAKKVESKNNFNWKGQIRHYLNDNLLQVAIMNSSINYGYEYNNQFSIVNTPLTEKCYRTIMEAFNYQYFAAIIGPSGTGKTETVINLAKIFALPFHIYNGNDKLSLEFIDRILKGLILCGAWICMKNYDRINPGILSVLSKKIVTISESRTNKIINFDSMELKFNKNCFITIILNSNTVENLPETLKYRFRTIAMLLPDLNQICRVNLQSSGFQKSDQLALKIKKVYQFTSELLPHRHDLRTMKIFLKLTNSLKQQYPSEEENILILRALIDVNISKFTENEIIIFEGILKDLFPDISLPNPNLDNFLSTFDECSKKYEITESCENIKLKIIQFFEMLHVHDGIVIIGEPLAGKSTIIKLLLEILQKQKNKISADWINPNAVTLDLLYGYNSTKEIEEGIEKGIFLKIFRQKEDEDFQKWIIFDGAIGEWIENLYSILDNRAILNSGEKLRTERRKIIIETKDLNQVSPLVVSHFGIITKPNENWRNYLKTEIDNLQTLNFPNYKIVIYSLFDFTIDKSFDFIEKHCEMKIKINRQHLLRSNFTLFLILLKGENYFESGKQEYLNFWVQAIFIISTIWSLGGILDTTTLRLFNSFFLNLWNSSNESRPQFLKQNEMSLPTEGLLTDYVYIFKGTGNWKHCSDLMKNEKISDLPFGEIFIPTVDTIKYSLLFEKFLKQKKSFILFSEDSVGKSSLLKDLFTKLENVFNFHFTSRMTGQKAQRLFLSKLTKQKSDLYGSENSSFNFIDNFNSDHFSKLSDSPLEIIRQFFDYAFWYQEDRKIFIRNMNFVIEMNKNCDEKLCRRFLRHFSIFVMHLPSKESIFRVFTNQLFLNLRKNSFTTDVMPILNGIITSTIDFYFSIKQTLKPIPEKLQYIFTLKDISKIIRALSIVQKESVETKITFIRLWSHEILRVFTDRITDRDDQRWYFSKIRETIKGNFKDSFESIFDNLPKSKSDELTIDSFDFLHFGNFINDRYEEIVSMDSILSKVDTIIVEYNKENSRKIDIVVTNFILRHLLRICRVLAIPEENLLLISSSGYGRKTIVRLASYMQGDNLFEPHDLESWRTDLKALLKLHIPDENFAVLITESFENDEFFDDVVNLLETGQIYELFSVSDEREIVKKVRLAAQNGNRNLELPISEVMDYFTKQCKRNLHFVICESLTNFPRVVQLAKNCTINYLSGWPRETFEKVTSSFLRDVPLKEEVKSDLKVCFQYFYQNIQRDVNSIMDIRITPVVFVRHVKLYRKIILAKQKELKIAKSKYLSCLEKLKIASNQVDQMKKVLMTLRPQLELSAEQTRITMEEVENENLGVEKATAIVKDEEMVANKKAEIAGKLRTECETDLAVAIPILEDAISALNTLKPADITLVKAMKNPPDTVKLVMAAVCVMLDVPSERVIDPVTGKKSNDFWGPSKRVLGDMNFLQNLKDYDKDNISSALMQIIKTTYMTDKSFLPNIVAKASSAAEGLCKWVRAMVSYDEVAKAVAPKKEKLALAQKECDDAEAYLAEKRETLADLNERLSNLKTSLETVLAKKQELEKEVEDCTDRLKKAESLLTSLGGEKSRWINCTDNLQNGYNSLAGDVLLASGFITYLSAFPLGLRTFYTETWTIYTRAQKIALSDTFSFTEFLPDGNHSDPNLFLYQNFLIIKHSDNTCLFIDPQKKAKEYIQHLHPTVKIITKEDDYLTIISNTISLGGVILFENFLFSNTLEPLFYRNENSITILKKKIPFSKDFRFYATVQTAKNLTTQVFNRLTIVNFTYPEEALEEKLLDIVIAKENYQLQDNYEKLQNELSLDRKILSHEEEKVLNILSTSSVNILEDRRALKILDSSKTMSIEILQREKIAKEQKERLQIFREGYSNFAHYSSELYTLIKGLENLQNVYQFSLEWYFQIYKKSIEGAKRSTCLEKRLKFLKIQLTKCLHSSVKNSLYEKDALVFSFTLSLKMLESEGIINRNEIVNFWNMEQKSNFEMVNVNKDLEKLKKVKVENPEGVLIACRDFVKRRIEFKGSKCDISLGFNESTCLSPLIFILPSEFELLPLIAKFARQKRYETKLFSIALNENQTQRAEFLIRDAQKNEKWIFLENCHLADCWLPTLEKIIQSFDANNTALGFRLWLSILPNENSPPGLFQQSIKITCDNPEGLKENLELIYNFSPLAEITFFDGCPGKDKIFSKLLYGLSFFHVLLKERISHDHRGWNMNYNFTENDFSLSAHQLKNLLNSGDIYQIYQTFYNLIENCSYGSKITNEYDRKRIKIFIRDFFNPNIANDAFYSLSEEISMPRRHEYSDYIKEIEKIGNYIKPEFFGLDKSGESIRNMHQVEIFQTSYEIMNKIPLLEKKIEIQQTLEIISKIRKKLPRFNLEEVGKKYPISHLEPLNAILWEEIKRTNFFLEFLENNFRDIEKAYEGDKQWNDEYENLSKHLILNTVPKSWKINVKSISTLIDDLSDKIEFLQKWINSGPPKLFNLRLFDSCKSLLTAIKMLFARTNNYPIEKIHFNTEITAEFEITNPLDFYLEGLFLLGGQWSVEKKMLVDNFQSTVWYEMPLICLRPEIKKNSVNFSNFYECPLYKVPCQEKWKNYEEDENNFIIKIPLASEINEKYWIKKGTALYTRKE